MRDPRSGNAATAWALVLILAGVSQAEQGTDPQAGPGRHTLKMEAVGHTWTYRVHVPRSYQRETPLPVVIVLHGAGGSGLAYLEQAGWGAKAEAAGFLAVAPDGLPARPEKPPSFLLNPRLWNSAQLRAESPRSKVDDVGFFDALLVDLSRRWSVDPRRVYVTGHSNGAAMAFRLGNERSERLAAIAPVSSLCWVDRPRPKRGLPTLFIVGTRDPLVPLEGGRSTTPWGSRITPPIQTTLDRWSQALGCPGAPKESEPRSGLKRLDYAPGRDGAVFTVYYIEGQGHGWPGGQGALPERLLGPNVETLKATDAIWEFFQEHSRNEDRSH